MENEDLNRAESIKAAMEALEQIQSNLSQFVLKLKNGDFDSTSGGEESPDAFANHILDELLSNLGISLQSWDGEEQDMEGDPRLALLSISRELKELQSKLEDTMIWHRSQAYLFALSYHNSVKQAVKANVPGAKEINDELNRLLEGKNTDEDG